MKRFTSEDIAAIERRRNPPQATATELREKDLHAQILEECRFRGWIAFHGSMAHRTFRILGEPDFVILRDGGGVILVEAKTRSGKLSTDQLAIQAWARKLGHEIHVVRSFDEFLILANK